MKFLRSTRLRTALATLSIWLAWGAQAEAPLDLTVRLQQPGAPVSPTMWGVFFEDINFGADGGLYAELIKNRSFEFPSPLTGWSTVDGPTRRGSIEILNQDPFNVANPHYLRLASTAAGGFGVINEGFRGIGVKAGERYHFSTQARCAGTETPRWRVELIGASGQLLASAKMPPAPRAWRSLTATLTPKATDPKARLQVVLDTPGVVDLDMVSLFPAKTWKGRPGGLRADMVQLLADLKPGFVRFPGGCIVEGHYLSNRYQWKTTVGPLAERKLIMNRWNDEFKHRPAPDYFQSFGLGFFEYFQLCEDIGAEPLPILNCGMACQFNSGELAPLDQLDPYIQDALDLIEFANGPVTTPWGKRRAELGHPRPFKLKLLGIGNEQWLQPYLDRYTAFARVLKARHPEIKLVSSAGPGPDDDKFHFAWPRLRELKADIIDEHCYARPDWFLNNSRRYDRYNPNGPKVFMGEYAAQSDKVVSVANRNNWECALAEAAFMTGLERNAGVVVMSSYAPLFAHEDAWQWRPNLIWCDNLRIYGTPNYYVQQAFSRNRGDVVLPVQLAGNVPAAGPEPRVYASAVRDAARCEVILKIVNATAQPVPVRVALDGLPNRPLKGTETTLTSALAAENNFETPRQVAPESKPVRLPGATFERTFPAQSLTVLRLPAR